MGDKNDGKGTPVPNPAQGVKTPPLPMKSLREGVEKAIVKSHGGKKK